MALLLYKDLAANVKIRLASAIAENHTVAFTAPPGLTINSGASLTFTPANYNTDQNLNVTATSLGTKYIPYSITSPYSQRVKSNTIMLPVLAEQTNFAQTGNYLGNTSFALRVATLNVTVAMPNVDGKSFTMRVKAGQGLSNSNTCFLYKDGVLAASSVFGTVTMTLTPGFWSAESHHNVSTYDSTTDSGTILLEFVNNFTGEIAEMSFQRAYTAATAPGTVPLGSGFSPPPLQVDAVFPLLNVRGVTIDTSYVPRTLFLGGGNVYLYGLNCEQIAITSGGVATVRLYHNGYAASSGFQQVAPDFKVLANDGTGRSFTPGYPYVVSITYGP